MHVKEFLKSKGAALEIWDDAAPNVKSNRGFVGNMDTTLARQCTFTLKDKLDYYVFFTCWASFVLVHYYYRH